MRPPGDVDGFADPLARLVPTEEKSVSPGQRQRVGNVVAIDIGTERTSRQLLLRSIEVVPPRGRVGRLLRPDTGSPRSDLSEHSLMRGEAEMAGNIHRRLHRLRAVMAAMQKQGIGRDREPFE